MQSFRRPTVFRRSVLLLVGTTLSGLSFAAPAIAAPTSSDPEAGRSETETQPGTPQQPAPAGGTDRSAQSAGREDPSSSGEVVVTARRRAESIIDVPLSLSVVGDEEIRNRNAVRLRDIGNSIPNVAFLGQEGNATTTFSVRGITSQSRINVGFESGVGVYVDGVLIGRQIGFNQELYDIERVEFLRGPQGTLFGRNSIAGAINIITRRPSDELRIDAEAQYAEYNEFQARAYVSAPITDRIAFSLSGFYLTRDGFQTNLFDNTDSYTEDSQGARAKLEFRPTENLRITVAGDVLDEDNVLPQSVIVGGTVNPRTGVIYGFVAGNTRNGNENLPGRSVRNIEGGSVTAELDTSINAQITSITAYRHLRSNRQNDTDVGPGDVVGSFVFNDQDQFSQELRIAGTTGPVSYVAGLYYYDSSVDSSSRSCFGNNTLVPGFIRGLCGDTFGTISTRSLGAFANADWRIADRLTLIAGLRYTGETKDLAYQQNGFPGLAPTLPLGRDSLNDTELSPTFSVRFEPNRDLSFYATASKGFRSGGWNVDNITSFAITSFAALRFGPESLWNYEVGARGYLFNRVVNFSAAIFQMDYTDLQVSKLEPVLGGGGALVAITTNAGEARVRGFEAEIGVRPIEGLRFSGGVGYADAVYIDYPDVVGGVPVNFRGNRLNNAPEWTVNLSGQYDVPLSRDVSFSIRADYSYIDDYFFSRDNIAAQSIPSRELVNGQIGLRGPNGRWEIFAFARNLFDTKYLVGRGGGGFAFPNVGTNLTETYGAPRQIGVRVGVHF